MIFFALKSKYVNIKVDLLGDQVEALLTLLEKIHATLYKYAPVLQQYFEVRSLLFPPI